LVLKVNLAWDLVIKQLEFTFQTLFCQNLELIRQQRKLFVRFFVFALNSALELHIELKFD
jgi:hypothetical protein